MFKIVEKDGDWYAMYNFTLDELYWLQTLPIEEEVLFSAKLRLAIKELENKEVNKCQNQR